MHGERAGKSLQQDYQKSIYRRNIYLKMEQQPGTAYPSGAPEFIHGF
jgi:hypothetical protein